MLYLLDSLSKMVGEPYKTLFGPLLAEVGGSGRWDACQGWCAVSSRHVPPPPPPPQTPVRRGCVHAADLPR